MISITRGKTFQPPFSSYRTTQAFAAFGEFAAGKYHVGMDIVPEGSDWTVHSIGDGKALTIPMKKIDPTNHKMGNVVIIEHFTSPKLYSLYAHLGSITVLDGQTVKAGDPIGLMGKTGDPSYGYHLHLELKQWPVIGNLSNSGPSFGYTLTHPNLSGYLDPVPFFDSDVVYPQWSIASSATTQKLYDRPSASSNHLGRSLPPGSSLTVLGEIGDWHLVRLPGVYGPATGWVYGRGSTSTNLCWIVNPDAEVGVNVRTGPSVSKPQVSRVWDGQCFLIKGEVNGWYEIFTDDSVGGTTGWVSKDYAFKFGTGGGEINNSSVSVRSATLYDGIEGLGVGNADSQINPSERCRIRLRLRNEGSSDLHNVRIKASENDPYLSLIDETSNAADIQAGGSAYDDRDIEFIVAATAPNSHRIEFRLEITSEEGAWVSSLKLSIARSAADSGYAFAVSDLILSDGVFGGGGNEDLIADSGELISLAYYYTYKFSDRPYRPFVVLESSDPYVTIKSSETHLAGFQEQDVELFRQSGASFGISPDCPIGHEIQLEFRIEKATAGRQILYRTPISFVVTKALPWSGLRITNLTLAGSNTGLSWSSRLGKEFVVQFSEDMVSWRSRPVMEGRPIEDSINISWDPAPPSHLYFRVLEQEPAE